MEHNRVKFLDGFRFLLALWVLLGHYYAFIGGNKLIPIPKFLNETLNRPAVAVYGFMIITGFLMSYNYIIRAEKEPYQAKSTFRNFWLRRVFRLYPVYLVVLIVAFITYAPWAEINAQNLIYFTGSNVDQWGSIRTTEQPGAIDLLTHIFMIHGLFPQYYASTLEVSWSLSLEMQFYFIFPFLFVAVFSNYAVLKQRLVMVLLVSMALAIVSPKFFDLITNRYHLPRFGLPSILTYTMPFFLLGMVSAGVKLRKISPLYLAVSLFLVVPFQWWATNIVIGAFLVLLFLNELKSIMPAYVYRTVDLVGAALSGRLAEFGANISYSMYLIHLLVLGSSIQVIIRFMPWLSGSKMAVALAGLVLTFVICVVVGHLLFEYIEKPFIEVGKRFIKRKRPQAEMVSEARG